MIKVGDLMFNEQGMQDYWIVNKEENELVVELWFEKECLHTERLNNVYGFVKIKDKQMIKEYLDKYFNGVLND